MFICHDINRKQIISNKGIEIAYKLNKFQKVLKVIEQRMEQSGIKLCEEAVFYNNNRDDHRNIGRFDCFGILCNATGETRG